MASHREGFTITEEFLTRQSTDGVKTVRRLLGELRAAGYIYRSTQRARYPAGSRNTAGKDISGALGPYTWFVTDKPEEIAVILAQYRAEAAGQDHRPDRQPVVTSRSSAREPRAVQPAAAADSPDLEEQDVPAAADLRPLTTGGSGSSIEDEAQKTTSNTNGGAVARPRTPASRHPLPDSSGGSVSELELTGDHPVVDVHREMARPSAGARVLDGDAQ